MDDVLLGELAKVENEIEGRFKRVHRSKITFQTNDIRMSKLVRLLESLKLQPRSINATTIIDLESDWVNFCGRPCKPVRVFSVAFHVPTAQLRH